METLAWAVPAGVAVVLIVPIVLAAFQLLDEVARLRAAARDLASLRPAVVELRHDAGELRRALARTRAR